MNYPQKGALIRALRAAAAAAIGAGAAVLVNQTPIVLEGTPFLVFATGIAVAIQAGDKFIRERYLS